MEDGLRECPFSTCGSSDAAWQHDRNKGVYFITCGSCDASGPMRKTKEEAVKAWNARTTDPLMEKMAEALEEIRRCMYKNKYSSYTLTDDFDPSTLIKVLQEYQERKDANSNRGQ